MNGILKMLLAALLLPVSIYIKANTPTYTLAEALKKKFITAEIKGNNEGHYGKCIQMKLTNLTANKFNVKLETGQQLVPDDSLIQNMMVTEQQLFVLVPKGSKQENINAMCIQKSDGGPGATVKFSMGLMSLGHLLGISKLIEKHKYFDGTGQDAVWCISDGADISSIHSDDAVKMKILQEFVSKATGQKIPARRQQNYDDYEEPRQPERNYKSTVIFEWNANREALTTLAVLDKNNKPVMEIVKNQNLPAGHHSYTIVLTSAEIPLGEYTIILYLNNQPKMQRRITLGP